MGASSVCTVSLLLYDHLVLSVDCADRSGGDLVECGRSTCLFRAEEQRSI
jgi:hypothetical protein